MRPVDAQRARAERGDAEVTARPPAVDDERGPARVSVAAGYRARRAEQDVSEAVAVDVACSGRREGEVRVPLAANREPSRSERRRLDPRTRGLAEDHVGRCARAVAEDDVGAAIAV